MTRINRGLRQNLLNELKTFDALVKFYLSSFCNELFYPVV